MLYLRSNLWYFQCNQGKAGLYTMLLFLLLLHPKAYSQNGNVSLLGNLSFPGQTLANVWGYASGGKEYALCSASKGLVIVDVSVPSTPMIITQIPGAQSLWREVTVFRNFAYVVTEGSGGALQIIDLSNLPGKNLIFHSYAGDGSIAGQLSTAHTLQVDTTRKVLYLYGSNLANGGALALDLSLDPYNPSYMGAFNTYYIHGGYADNDTVYAGNIYQGFFSVVDFRNKSAPVLLQTQSSPGLFTHSTWLSDDRKTLFVTDEATGAYLSSFDISDLNNIRLTDLFQSNPGSGSVPHNIHIRNGWAVASWYRDGLVIVDAHRPQNMVEVGNYDTYPAGSGPGMDGAWEAYPYLPSSHILVSNVNEGLFILAPQYLRACYLEGNVQDSLCNSPLHNVTVSIDSTPVSKNSSLDGNFHTGYYRPGIYTIRFSKPGYYTKIVPNVSLMSAEVTNLHVEMVPIGVCNFIMHVSDQTSFKSISGACVQLHGASDYLFYTDTSGNVSACNVKTGNYIVSTSKWGYRGKCLINQSLSILSAHFTQELSSGYYDDCSSPLGWQIHGSASTSWLYGNPVAAYDSSTLASPSDGFPDACIAKAYITNRAGGDAWLNDIDNGFTILTTPSFNLSNLAHPLIMYDGWFYDGGFKSGPPNDSLNVFLDNGITIMKIETRTAQTLNNGTWVRQYYQVADRIQKTSNMHLSFRINDCPPDNIVEGGLCYFEIKDSLMPTQKPLPDNHFVVYPNPFLQEVNVTYNLNGMGADPVLEVFDLTGKLISRSIISNASGTLNMPAEFDSGMYFFRMRTNSWLSRPLKVIKN